MATVLQIDQDHDIQTRYGQAFREQFVFSGLVNGPFSHRVVPCVNESATASMVARALELNDIDYVSANGHGLNSRFIGQDESTIWDATDDLTALSGAIVHLLSCQTGAVLGQKMVSAGVTAFWGYTTKFAFYYLKAVPTDLVSDHLAEPFLKMDILIDQGILSGQTASDTYQSVRSHFQSTYPKLNARGAGRAIFLSNFLHLVCPLTTWGDPEAVLH